MPGSADGVQNKWTQLLKIALFPGITNGSLGTFLVLRMAISCVYLSHLSMSSALQNVARSTATGCLSCCAVFLAN